MTFRKVDVRIWNDEHFRSFSDDGKLAFLFILTHPQLTALGAMRGTLDGLAAELGWLAKRFRAAIAPAVSAGMVEVNDTTAYIGLPNFLRYNEPEGPNSVKKAWLTALDSVPECTEKRALIQRCRKYLDAKSQDFKASLGEAIWEAFSDAIRDAIPDAIGDGYRDASPIQEQEQEQEQEAPPAPSWPAFPETLSGSDREILSRIPDAVASTRKRGHVAPSVLDGLAREFAHYPAVVAGAQIYLDRGYAAEGKDERYFLGIVRSEAELAGRDGNGHRPAVASRASRRDTPPPAE